MTTKAKRSLKIGPSALDRVRAACCLLPVAFCLAASAAEKPKVRAVTAFVRIDRDGYRAQVGEALATLRHAKAEFEKAGYQVESLRVTTQPFPEYARGLSRGAALSFFHEYAQLSAREHFDADVGPAMLRDGDDPAPAELLAEVLSTTTQLEASLVVAGEDGVHANAVRAAAKLIKHVAAHSPRSQGNFSFAATALVPPGTPFYPGSHHEGAGREFAVALESANVVAEVFRKVHEPAAAREKLVVALGRTPASSKPRLEGSRSRAAGSTSVSTSARRRSKKSRSAARSKNSPARTSAPAAR